MIIEYEESVISDIQGTVIDIETIGGFDRLHKQDSRQYRELKQVILGYTDRENLHIYCANGFEEINELKEMTANIVESLERPFFAFNCEFESGVWFHHIGIEVIFDGELQRWKYESKKEAVLAERIPNYDDPFFDDGKKCMQAWQDGLFNKAIAHNRACLLKERDLLINRGYRTPNEFQFIR